MRIIPMLLSFFITAVILVSCGESAASAEEKTEISRMDSVSKAVKDSTEKLEDQTKKVEESLEKLDKEFESATPNK